jgi:photosystem II stability/assembly factor-like uncharacterized protein
MTMVRPAAHTIFIGLLILTLGTSVAGGQKRASPLDMGLWQKVSSGTTLNLYGVSFATPSTGVAVGAYGVIRRSTTGGASWTAVPSPTASTLNSVVLSPSGLGWIAGVSNILKTTDFGAHWSKRWLAGADTTTYDTVDNYLILNMISFPVDSVGYAAGFYADVDRTSPVLFKSTDAGETWSDLGLAFGDTSFDQQMVLGLFFTDRATGFIGLTSLVDTVIDDTSTIFTLNRILKTTDGGATWSVNLPDSLDDNVADFVFTGPSRGYAVGNGTLLATTNAGSPAPSWSVAARVGNSLNAVTGSEALLVAVGSGGTIISSADGTSWNTEISGVSSTLWDVASRTGRTWAVGDGGKVLLRDTLASGTVQIDVQLNALWNLVSRPLIVDDSTLSALFPAPISDAFRFLGGSGYIQTDTLDRTDGYWVKFAEAQSVAMEGYPITAGAFPVRQGWNLIGSLTYPVPVDSIAKDPPGMSTGGYFGYDNGYAVSDTIVPGKGYWVKTDEDGTLRLKVPGRAPRSGAGRTRVSELMNRWVTEGGRTGPAHKVLPYRRAR